MILISACCGCDTCDDFTYKRFPEGFSEATVPEITATTGATTLHVTPRGFSLAGTTVYNPDGTLRLEAPAPPAANSQWLWISEETASDDVHLFAAKLGITGSSPDIATTLEVWRWDEATGTTTKIIDESRHVRRGWYDSLAATSTTGIFAYCRHALNTAGGFDGPVSHKWGDVRHGRIAIMGVGNWYNEDNESAYEFNSRIEMWDLDGNSVGAAEISNGGALSDSRNFAELCSGAWGFSNYPAPAYYFGWPKTQRVRIADDKRLYVLTTPSRTPGEWAISGFPGQAFNSAEWLSEPLATLWLLSDDVTASPAFLDHDERATWGRDSGFRELVTGSYNTYPDDATAGTSMAGPALDVTWNSSSDQWSVRWSTPTGGTGPFTYQLYVDGVLTHTVVDGHDYDLTGAISDELLFKVVVTDATADSADSNTVRTNYSNDTLDVLFPAVRDFDVRGLDVLVAMDIGLGAGNTRHAIARLAGPDSVTATGRVFGETWFAVFPDEWHELAGPILNDFQASIVAERLNTTGRDLLTVHAGPFAGNGSLTDLVISVRKHLTCDTQLLWHLEPSTTQTAGGGNKLHVLAGATVSDADDCPCDPQEADPCGICPALTTKPEWLLSGYTVDALLFDEPALVNTFKCSDATGGSTTNASLFYAATQRLRSDGTSGDPPYCRWSRCGESLPLYKEYTAECDLGTTVFAWCVKSNLPPIVMQTIPATGKIGLWFYVIDPSTYALITLCYYEADIAEACGPTATFTKIGGDYAVHFSSTITATREEESDHCGPLVETQCCWIDDSPEIPYPQELLADFGITYTDFAGGEGTICHNAVTAEETSGHNTVLTSVNVDYRVPNWIGGWTSGVGAPVFCHADFRHAVAYVAEVFCGTFRPPGGVDPDPNCPDLDELNLGEGSPSWWVVVRWTDPISGLRHFAYANITQVVCYPFQLPAAGRAGLIASGPIYLSYSKHVYDAFTSNPEADPPICNYAVQCANHASGILFDAVGQNYIGPP